MSCVICDNTGWVCEGHGNHPWRGVSNRPDSCDFGPGTPCPSSTCEHSLDRRDDDDTAALRAEVERLRAGNEDMRHTIHQWEPNMAALRADNERLRAALRPFAEAADGFDMTRIKNPEEWFAYRGIVSSTESKGAITVGDLRRARAALEVK